MGSCEWHALPAPPAGRWLVIDAGGTVGLGGLRLCLSDKRGCTACNLSLADTSSGVQAPHTGTSWSGPAERPSALHLQLRPKTRTVCMHHTCLIARARPAAHAAPWPPDLADVAEHCRRCSVHQSSHTAAQQGLYLLGALLSIGIGGRAVFLLLLDLDWRQVHAWTAPSHSTVRRYKGDMSTKHHAQRAMLLTSTAGGALRPC